MNYGHIIAIGGGGFGRNPKHNKIEKYILKQTGKEKPRILFVPTASGEDNRYIVNFYKCFSSLSCVPDHIKFFERTPRLDGIINKADIIYVGGGNTKSMLGVWKEWNFDFLLKQAYKKGKVLCGVSAGAICWFEQGVTDSWMSNLNVLNCLGFLEGMACPHYQEEPDRRPSLHNFLKKNKIKSGFAIDGGAAVHFFDGNYKDSLQFYKNSKVYQVSNDNGSIKEHVMKMKIL